MPNRSGRSGNWTIELPVHIINYFNGQEFNGGIGKTVAMIELRTDVPGEIDTVERHLNADYYLRKTDAFYPEIYAGSD